MRLGPLTTSQNDDHKRIEAEVVWEDSDLPTRSLYFETESSFADDFRASPEAFVLAGMAAACWRGEARVYLEGPVCPVMRDNALGVAANMARAHPNLSVPRLEVERGYEPTWPSDAPRTASFMSGGVDALTLLRSNRLAYPLDHPGAIRDCLLIFGLYGYDCDDFGPDADRLRAWEDLRGRLEGLADRESFTLIPAFTNVRTFAPDYLSWSRALYSSMTTAAAHCFSGRISTILYGSAGGEIEPTDVAAGQALCRCFSAAALEVRMESNHLARMDRVRLLSEWDEGLALMQPCHWVDVPAPGRINCGRCEKCVRTMLSLVLAGRLEEASAFADDDVDPAMIDKLYIASDLKIGHLLHLVAPLKRIGRRDLARAIRRRERKWRRRRK